jgi:hypothetical protein
MEGSAKADERVASNDEAPPGRGHPNAKGRDLVMSFRRCSYRPRLVRRSSVVSCLLGALLVSPPTASPHGSGHPWTTSMAQAAVKRGGLVQLPASAQHALTAEMTPLMRRYAMLEQIAWVEGDQHAAARFHNFWYRLSTARKRVQRGFPVRAAECTGAGAEVRLGRFRHFQCRVISHALVVPVADLIGSADAPFPIFIEREPRMVSPYRALFVVHATRNSALAYQQLGAATALAP